MKINTALVLCAGYGKRLNPLTLIEPKSLLKINDTTILENCINCIDLLKSFKVSDEKRKNIKNQSIAISEARIKIFVEDKEFYSAAEGNGPIHALDIALRKALIECYPEIKKLNLIDYKVRILTPQDGTNALVRVRIESSNGNERWSTIGVSQNVIDASYIALHDSITYHLLKS